MGTGKRGLDVPTAPHRVAEIPAGGVVRLVEAFAGEGGGCEEESKEEEEVEEHLGD